MIFHIITFAENCLLYCPVGSLIIHFTSMKKEDYCMWMGPFIVQAGACLCPCFNSERDFNSVKLHLPGDGVFVCLGLQLRFIYFVHQTYGMCTVCFCRSDEWAKYTHSICDYISSSPVLRGPARSWRCFFFPFFVYTVSFCPLFFYSAIFFFPSCSPLSSMTWSLWWKGSSLLIASSYPTRSTTNKHPLWHLDTEVRSA